MKMEKAVVEMAEVVAEMDVCGGGGEGDDGWWRGRW